MKLSRACLFAALCLMAGIAPVGLAQEQLIPSLPVPRVVSPGESIQVQLYGVPFGTNINVGATTIAAGFEIWFATSVTGSGKTRTLTFNVPLGAFQGSQSLSIAGQFTNGQPFLSARNIPIAVSSPNPTLALSFSVPTPGTLAPGGSFTITATGIPGGQAINFSQVNLYPISSPGQYFGVVTGVSPLIGGEQTLTVAAPFGLPASNESYEIDITGNTTAGGPFASASPAPRIVSPNTIAFGAPVAPAGPPGATFSITGTNFPPAAVIGVTDVALSFRVFGFPVAAPVLSISPASGPARTIVFRMPATVSLPEQPLLALPANDYELSPLINIAGVPYEATPFKPVVTINVGTTSFISLTDPVSVGGTLYEMTGTGFTAETFEPAGMTLAAALPGVVLQPISITPAAASATRTIRLELLSPFPSGQSSVSVVALSTVGNRVQGSNTPVMRLPFMISYLAPAPVPGQPDKFTVTGTNFPAAETLPAPNVQMRGQHATSLAVVNMIVESITPNSGAASRTIAFAVPAVTPAGNYNLDVNGITASQVAVMTESPKPVLDWTPPPVEPPPLPAFFPYGRNIVVSQFSVAGEQNASSLPTGRNIVVSEFSVGGAQTASALPAGRNIVVSQFSLDGTQNASSLLTGRNIVVSQFSVGGAQNVSMLPPGRNIVVRQFSVGGAQNVSSLLAGRNIAVARFSVGGAENVSSLPTGRNTVVAQFSVGGAENVSLLPTGRNIAVSQFSVGGAQNVSSLPAGRNIAVSQFSVGGGQNVSSLPTGRNIVMSQFSVGGTQNGSSLPGGRNIVVSQFSVGGTQTVSSLPAGRNTVVAQFSVGGAQTVSSLPAGRNIVVAQFSVGGAQTVSSLPAGRNIVVHLFSAQRGAGPLSLTPVREGHAARAAAAESGSPTGLDALTAGQIVTLAATALEWPGIAGAEFRAQGKLLSPEQASPPFQVSFAVPAGVENLTLEIVAKDGAGNGLGSAMRTFQVQLPRTRTLQGKVLDPDGNPLANAEVQLDVPGLAAEYFDSQTPLVTMPDFTGRTPDRAGAVLALLYPNPDGAFGRDPFGAALPPDYAARFRGFLEIPNPGEYRFTLESSDGAELYLEGRRVEGPLKLEPGRKEIEVRHFSGVAPPKLVLSWSTGEQAPRALTPAWLFHRSAAVRTNGQGEFSVEDSGLPGDIRAVTPTGEGAWVEKNLSRTLVLPAFGVSKEVERRPQ